MLRTSWRARYFFTFLQIKLFLFEPIYVGLQMLPGMQIISLLMIQLYSNIWTYKLVVQEKAFSMKTTGASQLINETALSLFLLIGLIFYIGGGADKFQDSVKLGL